MVDINTIEKLVNNYVDCWKEKRPKYTGIYEDNDLGCETLQIFRNGFRIEEFTHRELCLLSIFLTRSLRGQINRDHKIFWSWCSSITREFRDEPLFQDHDWVNAFESLVHLVLANRRHRIDGRFIAGPGHLEIDKECRKFVNYHLLMVALRKHLLAGPQAFGVLEGLLRRKNKSYVSNEGIIHRPFTVMRPTQHPKTWSGGRLNRIDDSLRLFEQVVVKDRHRLCSALGSLKDEIAKLYSTTTDVFDLIDSWRNDLVHGNKYWQNRVPVILNIICLLTIDDIEPNIYDSRMNEIRRTLEWQRQNEEGFSLTKQSPWDTFPPDVNH